MKRIEAVESQGMTAFEGQQFALNQEGVLLLPHTQKVTVEDLKIEPNVPRSWIAVEVPENLVDVPDKLVHQALKQGSF